MTHKCGKLGYNKQYSHKSLLANRGRNYDTFGAHTTLSGRQLLQTFTTLLEKKILSSISRMRLFIQHMNITSSSLDKTLFKTVNDCGII